VESGMRPIDWESLDSEDQLKKTIAEVFEEVGISGGAFTYTPIGSLPSGSPGLLRRALPINIDESLLEGWFQYEDDIAGPARSALSQSFDPVRRRMSQKVLPEWIVLREFLADKSAVTNVVAANWIKTLIRAGIRESFHVPVFTGRGEYWSLAAFRFEDSPDTGPLSEDVLCQLHWMTVNLVAICIDRFGWRDEKPEFMKHPLTPREQECLYWAAQGHSTIETAEILGIQNETVRQYIKQALKKLNARNKTQAIWLAHRLGYLALP
jgi:DNA-binding CsgD family transcriptional regulator